MKLDCPTCRKSKHFVFQLKLKNYKNTNYLNYFSFRFYSNISSSCSDVIWVITFFWFIPVSMKLKWIILINLPCFCILCSLSLASFQWTTFAVSARSILFCIKESERWGFIDFASSLCGCQKIQLKKVYFETTFDFLFHNLLSLIFLWIILFPHSIEKAERENSAEKITPGENSPPRTFYLSSEILR